MTLHTTTISSAFDPLLDSIRVLYESSFPINERRHWNAWLRRLKDSEMKVEAFFDNNQFIGFVTYWVFKDWIFVEHLAIEPDHRNKGYGKQVINCLLLRARNGILLETQLPITMEDKRRKKFYERLGFMTIPIKYWQPPYRKNEDSPEMELMTSSKDLSLQLVVELVDTIKNEVYTRFW